MSSLKRNLVGIVIGLAIGVMIGYFLSIVTLARLYHTLGEQEAYINGLKDEIYSKDVEISDLQSQLSELSLAYEELEETYLPKPPVSKDQAIDIALEYGEWNETSLADMEVTANLKYYMYLKRGSESGVSFLHEVVAHVSDYGPKEMGSDGWRTTFRYVWVVVVSQKGMVKSIPPPGLYHVDASTGDVVFDCYLCL